jgi:hypothetical protein
MENVVLYCFFKNDVWIFAMVSWQCREHHRKIERFFESFSPQALFTSQGPFIGTDSRWRKLDHWFCRYWPSRREALDPRYWAQDRLDRA